MKQQLAKWLLTAAIALSLFSGSTENLRAERPPTPKLLPPATLAMARISDFQQLSDRFQQTALGRMVQDPQIKPLIGQLYKTAEDAYKRVEEQVGMPLNDLLAIPQGEISVAFVCPPDQPPGLAVVFDVGDRVFQVRKLLERGEEVLRKNGGSKTPETIGSQEVACYRAGGNTQLYLLQRDASICLTSSKEIMQFLITAWDGAASETLADVDKFNTIMSRCGVGGPDSPQITWFVDPIELVRRLARGSFAATGLALLPVLGLDGLEGAGGSMVFAAGEFDEIQHFHIALDQPRTGVLEAVALRAGDSTPESWVPSDCVTYTTFHWDLNQTLKVASKLYNGLVGENALQQEIRTRVSDKLGADFEKELLPYLDGRGTFVQWVEKPVRINSIAAIMGARLRDPEAFQPTFDKIVQKHSQHLEKQRFGNVTYWSAKVGQQMPKGDKGPALRQPTPCFGIVGNYLIFSDSPLALQECVLNSGDSTRGLANSLDYKLIASKIKRQPGGDAPGMVQFSRPEEGMRFWYDLAAAEDTKRRLTKQAENNGFFRSVDQALKDHPLPPFSVLEQYFAPGGGMMVNDETGLHYMTFTLKRQ